MNPTVVAALIGAIATIGATVITSWWQHGRSELRTPKNSRPFGAAVLKRLELSNRARKKLGRSVYIVVGGTRNALMQLLDSAEEHDSILAICGSKGDFSREYYERNFARCKAVKRVFSYEAIHSEITGELTGTKVRYALDGLMLHLDETATRQCDVEALLVPKGRRIRDIGGGDFAPPPSFGLAILCDGNGSPRRAIVHWEIAAEPLGHLIAIEGVVVDDRQQELLKVLVQLHESIAGSNSVLSSKRDSEALSQACAEMEREAQQHHLLA